jgi:hypothetical protein
MPGIELAARAAPLAPLDTKQVTKAMTAYQEGLKSILDDSDWQEFEDKKGEPKRFLKRSGWRKIAFWFGLDLEVLSTHVERDTTDQPTRARVIARATAPNGRHADGDGYCSVRERRFSKPENDIPATAATRALNRAISNLVGMGDVSAEELEGDEGAPAYGPAASQRDRDSLDKAARLLYDTEELDLRLVARLEQDAGGYLPRIVARAVMLLAAHRPGRPATAETDTEGTDTDTTPTGQTGGGDAAPDEP